MTGDAILSTLRSELAGNAAWASAIEDAAAGRRGVHLAVFVEPYLGYVLDGSKSIESRFSATRCAPWDRVHAGDLVLLKASGGPLVGVCLLGEVWSYRLNPGTCERLRAEFTEALRAQDPAFWESRRQASYATLMRIDRVSPITPSECPKRDRRGWVVVAGKIQLPLAGAD